MLKKLKENISGLAILSFILAIFSFVIPFGRIGLLSIGFETNSLILAWFFGVLWFFLRPFFGFSAVIIGIIVLVNWKNIKSKDKLFAILGVLIGMFGILVIDTFGFHNLFLEIYY